MQPQVGYDDPVERLNTHANKKATQELKQNGRYSKSKSNPNPSLLILFFR